MYKLLVIDDEESILSMLAMAFIQFGFSVETAANGLDGINKFDECNFDIVITDINMPLLDGNGVIRHIRNSKRQNTPVIAISGTPWLLADGDFNAVFSKPTSIKTLVDTVKNMVCSN